MPWAPVPAPWAHQAPPGAEPVWGPSGAAIETTWDPKLEGVQKDRGGSVFYSCTPKGGPLAPFEASLAQTGST